MRYCIVIPQGYWTQWESANFHGSPAAHIVMEDNPSKTLCGRPAEYWAMARDDDLGIVSCKICLGIMRKRGIGAEEAG
jgi:hypothetical protein